MIAHRGVFLLYNLLLWAAALVALPFFLVGLIFLPRWRDGLFARFGAVGELPRHCIWFHAASLGEVRAVEPIVRAVRQALPGVPILMSTATTSGLARARSIRPGPHAVILMPLEFPFVLRRIMRKASPRLLVITETELWPNFIRHAKLAGATVMVVNGRLSAEGAARYAVVRPFFRIFTFPVDVWAMRSQEDLERGLQLGIPAGKMRVTGNIKFRMDPPSDNPADTYYRTLFKGLPVFTAGSTRPGEEAVILDAMTRLLQEYPELRLVLAPRHLERIREVSRLVERQGLSWRLRSEVHLPPFQEQVLLLDTMGELTSVYKSSQVAFVGGTLQPFGGHNVLEPPACGVPVLFGPHTEHFREESDVLLGRRIGVLVTDAGTLAASAGALLGNAAERERIRERAHRLFEERESIVRQNARFITGLWKEAAHE